MGKRKSTEKQEEINKIIRVKSTANSFMIDKSFLEDERLSFTAKGILTYLLSKDDNWEITVTDLAGHSGDGEAEIYSGLDELEKYGYIGYIK